MAIITESWCFDFGVIATSVILAVYLLFRRRYNFWKKFNVPHVDPKFLSFDIGLFSGKIHTTLNDIYNSFKEEKVIGLWSIITPVLVIKDLDLLNRIFIRDFKYFHSRNFYMNEKEDPLEANLIFLDGEKWKFIRQKLTPTFTPSKMKMMFPILVEKSEVLVEVLDKLAERREIVAMKNYLERHGMDVISSCAFGVEANSLRNPESIFRKMGKKLTEATTSKRLKRLVFFSPKLAELLKFKFTDQTAAKFFINAVRETINYRKVNNIKRDDFMQLLIQLMENGKLDGEVDETEARDGSEEESSKRRFTLEEVTAQACQFFAAGFETTSSAMDFSLYELALKPDIQEKLRTEIKLMLAKYDNRMTFQGIHEIELLGRVIDETLRKYPITFLTRQCYKDYKVDGTDIVIPKGTRVVFPIYSIHHDPVYFPNPEVFDPDRFTDEAKSERHPCAYLPFGNGPRVCIGMRFAMMNMRLVLVKLLSRYKFEICEKSPVPMSLVKRGPLLKSEKKVYLRISICA